MTRQRLRVRERLRRVQRREDDDQQPAGRRHREVAKERRGQEVGNAANPMASSGMQQARRPARSPARRGARQAERNRRQGGCGTDGTVPGGGNTAEQRARWSAGGGAKPLDRSQTWRPPREGRRAETRRPAKPGRDSEEAAKSTRADDRKVGPRDGKTPGVPRTIAIARFVKAEGDAAKANRAATDANDPVLAPEKP